jgi:hypothetical protein
MSEIVRATARNDKIGAYLVSSNIAEQIPLNELVDSIRSETDKPIIVSINKTSRVAAEYKKAGINAVLLHGQRDLETEQNTLYHMLSAGMTVILGKNAQPSDFDPSFERITNPEVLARYELAARASVPDVFVSNASCVVKQVRETLEAQNIDPVFYSHVFVCSEGITPIGKAAGDRFHSIKGREICEAKDPREAAHEYTKHL